MRRLLPLTLSILAVAGVVGYLVAGPRGGPPRGDGSTSAREGGPTAPAEPLPGLSARPEDARPARPAAAEAPGARRSVRARLVTVDERTGEPVDPQAPFGLSLGTGAEWDPDANLDRRDGVLRLAASIPAGATGTDVTVTIEGWGFLPYRGRYSLRARPDGKEEEITIPLRAVAADAWTTQHLVLEGPGDTVGDDEFVAVQVSPLGTTYGPPSVLVEFLPGSPRRRDVRVPAAAMGTMVMPVLVPVTGPDGVRRTEWVDPRAVVRPEPRPAADGTPATTVLRSRPHSTLEVEVRYPPGKSRPVFELFGSQSDKAHPEEGRQGGGFTMTYGARVVGGPDVLRILLVESDLQIVSVRGPGVTGAVDPPGRLRLRPPDVVRATLTLSASPPASAK